MSFAFACLAVRSKALLFEDCCSNGQAFRCELHGVTLEPRRVQQVVVLLKLRRRRLRNLSCGGTAQRGWGSGGRMGGSGQVGGKSGNKTSIFR